MSSETAEYVTGIPLVQTYRLAYRYKFNGQEFQDELGLNLYDMNMRDYDPAIGRWTGIDPVVDYDRSPYNGFDNNPVFWADPSGAKVKFGNGTVTATGDDAGSLYSALIGYMDNGFASFEATGDVDNDCPSCKTKEDWAAYYQQAENTASMIGEKSAWDIMNKRLTTMPDGEGHTLFYLDGELMDLRRYDNRAHAFGSLLSDAALFEAPTRLFKFLGSFFKSGSTKTAMGLADDFLASATKPWGDQGLTNIGRALQKHAGREGSIFQGIKFSHKTANQDALNILENIFLSKNKIIQQPKGGGLYIFDGTTGMGFGVSREGLFNGFRELPK